MLSIVLSSVSMRFLSCMRILKHKLNPCTLFYCRIIWQSGKCFNKNGKFLKNHCQFKEQISKTSGHSNKRAF